MKTVYEQVKRVRQEKGLNQSAMARLLGIAPNNYGKLERGETQMTIERLEQIADILEVSTQSLLFPGTSENKDEEAQREVRNLKKELDLVNKENELLKQEMSLAKTELETYQAIMKQLDKVREANDETKGDVMENLKYLSALDEKQKEEFMNSLPEKIKMNIALLLVAMGISAALDSFRNKKLDEEASSKPEGKLPFNME